MAEHIIDAAARPVDPKVALARLDFLKEACCEVATAIRASVCVLHDVGDGGDLQRVLADCLEHTGYLADHALAIVAGEERELAGYCWTFSPSLKKKFEAIQAAGSRS